MNRTLLRHNFAGTKFKSKTQHLKSYGTQVYFIQKVFQRGQEGHESLQEHLARRHDLPDPRFAHGRQDRQGLGWQLFGSYFVF